MKKIWICIVRNLLNNLISVVVRFEWSLLGESEVGGLVFWEFCENRWNASQVKGGDFLVQMFRKNVDLSTFVFIGISLK